MNLVAAGVKGGNERLFELEEGLAACYAYAAALPGCRIYRGKDLIDRHFRV